MMQWDKLLSDQRRFHPTPGPRPQPLRSAFEQDADRIQFSPDFGQLQDKTQVHQSPDNDSAREVVQREHALRALRETFVPAASVSGSELSQHDMLARRYLDRCLHLKERATPDERVRSVDNFITGMTDRYTLRLARELRGA